MGLTNSDCPQALRRGYQAVHQLQAGKRPMMYPMPLISDLLQGLDKPLYGERLLSRAHDGSGLRDISIYHSVRPIRVESHAFFAPQIYQRLVVNVLYGFLKIPRSGDPGNKKGLFQTAIADNPDRHTVLGRRSYIDDIMSAAES
ncbi:reverse transcriptase [Phytophthora megakarya]|uniref:Reverse transcriptase n=1 Tax=Phytophthora megakarya TaxID=4795 RepID=A0A225W4I5_9STRA|nr:reverse transcriptase [Phytophthora megakarya]